MLAIITLLVGCADKPTVVPYSAEECALAPKFEEACLRLDEHHTDDEGFTIPQPPAPSIDDIVAERNALGVSKDRVWWCHDPSRYSNYLHTADFWPTLDNCPAAANK